MHFMKEWGLAGYMCQHTLIEAVLQSVEFSKLLIHKQISTLSFLFQISDIKEPKTWTCVI